jgi:alkane 1-monooxygenase
MRDFPRKLGYLLPLLLPILWLTGHYLGGGWNYLVVIAAFGVLPVLDALLGIDPKNYDSETERHLSEAPYYRLILYSWTFIQLALLVWACYRVTFVPLSLSEWIGFLLSAMTIFGGIGITVAHELGHKPRKLDQTLAKILLATVFYRHFIIEHNRGHHVNVGTPLDPATARKNQSFYSFWWQTVWGSLRHAWELEVTRLRRAGKNPYGWENEIWHCFLEPILLLTALTTIMSLLKGAFAWQVPVFFLTQSFLSFSLLEVVNYIEHYGMQRRLLPNGKYERVNPLHSWNASFLLTNFFLFQLQRHSDHHAYATREYQILRHFDESPQLPAGYPTMVLLALIPPLWFRVMNPLLEAWEKRTYPPSVEPQTNSPDSLSPSPIP